MIVSQVLKADGLDRMDELAEAAREAVSEHPDLISQLVIAVAVFARELPPAVVAAALDRLVDDEQRSWGTGDDSPT